MVPYGTLVDTNVLLDVFTEDANWAEWSRARLIEAFDEGQVILSPIVYAELAVGFERIEDLDHVLPRQLIREALPWEAAFLAGRAFQRHLRRGGSRRAPLPDFFIAAHAAVSGRTLLTRDGARHVRAVPGVRLRSPDDDQPLP